MSEMLKRLIAKQNRLHNRMQEIQQAAEDESRDWTAEERTNWDAANADIDVVSADIERLERQAKLDNVDYRQVLQGQGPDTPEQPVDRGAVHEEAFGKYLRRGLGGLTNEQRQLMLENRDVAATDPQGTAPDAAGGFLVPPGYRAVMTEALLAYGGLLNHANVITTGTGNPLQWPTNQDSVDNIGAILSENPVSPGVPEQGTEFGSITIGAFTYTSKLVRVSLQLLQDSAFDLNTWLPRKLGERIGRAVAADLVNGTGGTMPQGILENAVVGASGPSLVGPPVSSGVDYDSIIDLEHSIDPAYRGMGNCRYLMHDSVLAVVRKVKDADGRPLWLPVPVPGQPSTINGLPYSIDQAMPPTVAGALVAGTKHILFGDFRAGFIVRQVLDVQMLRLAERYAEYLQVGFFGFSRLDSVPDDPRAVRAWTATT